MTEQQKHFPEFYVTTPQPCPYLPGKLERKLFTHLTHDKPLALIDNLLNEVNVSTLWSTAIYGTVLVLAVVVGAVLSTARGRTA